MGFPHEAMVDMTGGVAEVFNVASLPRNLLDFLKHLLAKGALINCANSQVGGGGRSFMWDFCLLWFISVDLLHSLILSCPWANVYLLFRALWRSRMNLGSCSDMPTL